jgi:glycosyltransferase involved in cell wall biosynthesis
LFARIKAQAEALPNVEFVGFVPYAQIEPHFDGARVFVNTSANEGFPNTFLQAWSRGIPTVSFCNTASVVDGRPVTHVVTDVDEMTGAVRELMGNDEVWLAAGARARRCAEQCHTLEAALGVYEQVFNRLCGTASGSTVDARKPAA